MSTSPSVQENNPPPTLNADEIEAAWGDDESAGTGAGEGTGDGEGDGENAHFDAAFGEGDGEGDGDGEASGKVAAEPVVDEHAEAPEFWSAEHKAIYASIQDPKVRAALHAIEKERVANVNKKIEETALAKKGLEDKVATYEKDRDELAAWWSNMGPRLANAFQSKWAKYANGELEKLAESDPAEYVKVKAAMDHDFDVIRTTAERHKQEIAAANQRAAAALEADKAAEYGKLAKKLPAYFAPDKAQATYDKLGKYLVDNGVPAEAVPGVYKAPVVEIALKAMIYDEGMARLKAKGKAQGGEPNTAGKTPRRVAPGPARKAGNQNGSDVLRQAEQRLKNTGTLTDPDEIEAAFG